jgi:hypothetical protein
MFIITVQSITTQMDLHFEHLCGLFNTSTIIQCFTRIIEMHTGIFIYVVCNVTLFYENFKMLKLCTTVKNNVSCFLLYFQACTPENDIVTVETCRVNLILRTYGAIDCTVTMNNIMDYNGVHYNIKTNILHR